MGKSRINSGQNAKITNEVNHVDGRDREILGLLLSGQDNRTIADKLKIPMSTVQRRTRKLFERGIVKNKVELNYEKLGIRKGMLHVYLKDGNIHSIAEMISGIKGMQSTSIHVGNSDVVGYFIFKDATQILDLMSQAKRIQGVDHVVWSEEVLKLRDGNNKAVIESL